MNRPRYAVFTEKVPDGESRQETRSWPPGTETGREDRSSSQAAASVHPNVRLNEMFQDPLWTVKATSWA